MFFGFAFSKYLLLEYFFVAVVLAVLVCCRKRCRRRFRRIENIIIKIPIDVIKQPTMNISKRNGRILFKRNCSMCSIVTRKPKKERLDFFSNFENSYPIFLADQPDS